MSEQDQNTIEVVTGDVATRSRNRKQLKVSELADNVNQFLDQMGGILASTPKSIGQFQFTEFEVHAEVTAKGSLAILGTGGEAGATGGLKFVFKRVEEPKADAQDADTEPGSNG
jgi:hypothetical protein